MAVVGKINIDINTICDVCKSYPVATGEVKEGKFEHKCPKCGSICFKDKSYPYKHEVDRSTYL